MNKSKPMSKVMKKIRMQVDEYCERINEGSYGSGDSRLGFKWQGDRLFILRDTDLGNGYASAEVYQLGELDTIEFVSFMSDYDFDDDDVNGMDVWEFLEAYKLVEFGE